MTGIVVAYIAAGIIGYLLGSINTALVVGRIYGRDIRKSGSGNAGLTNVLRTMGKIPALLVLAGDILKGVAACLAGLYLAGSNGIVVAGLAAVAGHNWPVYFGFRGGKGVLTTITVIFMADWRIGLILLGIFAVIVAISRFVSLGSIIGAAAFPFISLIFGKSTFFIIFSAIFAILVIIRHSSNISRLARGEESKLGAKKPGGEPGGHNQ